MKSFTVPKLEISNPNWVAANIISGFAVWKDLNKFKGGPTLIKSLVNT